MEGADTVSGTWVDAVGDGVTTDGGELLWHPATTPASPRAKQGVHVRARIAVN
jgi:hypothetical protein